MEQLRRDLRRVVLRIAIADIVVLALAIWGAWQLRLHLGIWPNELSSGIYPLQIVGAPILLVWLVMLVAEGAYSLRVLGEGPEEPRRITRASLLTAGAVALIFYLAHYPLVRGYMLAVFLLGIPALHLERLIGRRLLHRARRNGRLTHRVLAVGAAQSVAEVAAVLEREKQVGMHVVGACLTDAPAGEMPVPVLGTVDELLAIARDQQADTVLVARGGFETSAELRRVTWELEDSGLDVVIVPSMTDVAGQRLQMRPVAGLPLLHLEPPTARAGRRVAEAALRPGRLVSGAGAGLSAASRRWRSSSGSRTAGPVLLPAGARRTWRRGVPDPEVPVHVCRRRRPRGLVARARRA